MLRAVVLKERIHGSALLLLIFLLRKERSHGKARLLLLVKRRQRKRGNSRWSDRPDAEADAEASCSDKYSELEPQERRVLAPPGGTLDVQDPRHVQLRPVVPVVDDQCFLNLDVGRDHQLLPGDVESNRN
jgi:hypothetical protein